MKNCEYNANFKEDIKKVKSKFNMKKFLKQQGINLITCLYLDGIFCIVLGAGGYVYLGLVLATMLLQTVVSAVYISIVTEIESNEALNRVCNLYENIDLEYDNLVKEKIKECKENTYLTNESYTYIDGKLKITEKEFTTDFYLLDSKEQLQVLRQVKKEIINGKEKEGTYKLFLLEEEDKVDLEKTFKKNKTVK